MQDVTNRSRVDVGEVEREARALLSLFAEHLRTIEQSHAAAALPLLDRVPVACNDDDVLAATIGFHLLGLVEQRAAARHRAAAEARGEAESGLWSSTLAVLAKSVGAREVRDAIASTRVEAVFTAHPTEARRLSALEMYRDLYALFPEERSLTDLRAHERERIVVVLERLYRSGEIRVRKPDVADECAFVIDVVTRVLPGALEENARRLRAAAARAAITIDDVEPRVRFSTWIGGDRDGHPLVTGQVTSRLLEAYRRAAVDLQRASLVRLGARLSLSALRQPTPPVLHQAIDRLSSILGPRAVPALERNAEEPWRTLISLVGLRLPQTEGTVEVGSYTSADEAIADLSALFDALVEVHAERIARAEVLPIIRQLRTFGFHLLSLDIRQNSRVHELAIDRLLAASGHRGTAYSEWDEPARLAWLTEEIARGRPFLPHGASLDSEAKTAVEAFAAAAHHLRTHGEAGLGSLIVSMTRQVSDLLAVVVLAREGGLLGQSSDGSFCPLPIVPLFETIDDLERAPGLLDTFLKIDVVARGIAMVAKARGFVSPVQQVMVGYSDSNKDGGITASLRSVQNATRAMVEVGRHHGVHIELFHGRGGTLSRGAGPTHRFLSAQPRGALEGGLRLTEQGETILQKYGNLEAAEYNLELLTAGTTRRVALDRADPSAGSPFDAALDSVAKEARRAYERFIGMDGFFEIFREATPIDVIETSGIGSRPTRRTGQNLLSDLRAIPWVFAWAQSRFGITGWYGLGSGLEALEASDPDLFAMLTRTALDWPPLRYIVANVSVGVLGVDLAIAREYATLLADETRRRALLGAVESELHRTRAALERIYDKPLEKARERIHALLSFRAEALRAVHRRQLELLCVWRAGGRADEALRLSLLGTVNAIAAGLRTTG